MKKIKIGVIIAVTIFVIAGVTAFYHIKPEEKKETTQDEVKIIDNRISPYTNQGLTVQVLRIRNRELLGKINKGMFNGWINLDRSWQTPPKFFYKTEVDGRKTTSKGAIGVNGQYFNRWDTITYPCRDKYFTEEEKEYSEITLSIVEIVPKGILGRKTEDIVIEEINLRYDYKTARWTGKDSYLDSDGTGHYLGDTYEVWFNIYQRDYDNDKIPYWAEVNILGTDPTVDDSELDPDKDGIPTDWEYKWGYDPFTYDDHKHLDPDVDGLQNYEEYMMRDHFADPYQPDMYLEVDYMEKKNAFDLDHILHEESKQMVIERFAQHGINLYVDDGWGDGPVNGGGEMLPFMEAMPEVTGGQCFKFYENNFADERKGVFRYCYMANIMGYITAFEDTQYDIINIGTGWQQTKNYVQGLFWTKRARLHGIASGLLHELGHSIGLMPVTYYGNDIIAPVGTRYPNMPEEEYAKYLEQYHSVMNYDYIYRDKDLMDYSDGSNGEPYDQNDWEYIYIPAFETDQPSFEEPDMLDPTFEDFEVVDEYPGVILRGYVYDENLTEKYSTEFKDLALIKSTDKIDIQIFRKEEKTEDGYDIKIYAKPDVGNVFSIYNLVAEGKLDSKEDTIMFYSFDSLFDEAIDLLNSQK